MTQRRIQISHIFNDEKMKFTSDVILIQNKMKLSFDE
jgi:hypothetical protein